jgi:hypothetical protein
MAKKRGGEGSNLGLIMTLVFFILTTVILGVTTYMGYNEIEKEKSAATKAKADEKEREKERNWARFQAWMCREYMGQPSTALDKDQREILVGNKKQFETGGLDYARGQKDEADFKALTTKMQQDMPWSGDEKSPSSTYESRLTQLGKEKDAMANKAKQAEDQRNEETARANRLDADLKQAKMDFDNELVKLKASAKKDLEDAHKEIAKLRGDVNRENQEKLKEKDARDLAEKQIGEKDSKLKAARSEVTKERDLRIKERDEKDRYKQDRDTLLAKSGTDPSALEAETIDAKALEVLKSWPEEKKKWQIIRLDQKGTMPYINLGSADGLQTQMTFSIHSMGLDNKLAQTPKGTVEVVQILEPHLARVRVTSVKDASKDPIVKGDRLFNPTWDPGNPRRVAIAGLADMGGDGLDSSEDLRRLLKRQNVAVDAYIDTKTDKQPEVKNDKGEKGDITNKTEYLILADGLDAVKHDKARDKEYSARFDKLVNEMKEKAKANGATVIQLRRYLEMIGYKPPKPAAKTSPGATSPGYGR